MPPFLGGGEMIREVRFEGTVFNDPPHKFEAGTPNIAGFVGLGAAVDYLQALGMDAIEQREQALLAHAHSVLGAIPGLRRIADVAHVEGALLIGQLNMGGRQHLASRVVPFMIAPSAIACRWAGVSPG